MYSYCVIRQVEPFVKEEKKGNGDPSVKKAVIEAERALLMSTKDREELIKCVPSDEEDDDDDEDDEGEQMEVDAADKDDTQRSDSDDDDDVDTGRKVRLMSKKFLSNKQRVCQTQ